MENFTKAGRATIQPAFKGEGEYDYKPRPRWGQMALLLLVAVVLFFSSRTLPSVLGGTAFGVAIGSGIGIVAGLGFVALNRSRCSNKLILSTSALVLPKNALSSQRVSIEYRSIQSLDREKVHHPVFGATESIHIVHTGGSATIDSRRLTPPNLLHDIFQYLQDKCAKKRADVKD